MPRQTPPNPANLKKVCQDLARKLSLAGPIERSGYSFDEIVEYIKNRFKEKYHIKYKGEHWQEILAAREFIRVLAGGVFHEQIMEEIARHSEEDRYKIFSGLKAALSPTAAQQAGAPIPPADPKFIDPFSWDIPTPIQDNPLLLLTYIVSAMKAQETGVEESGGRTKLSDKMISLAKIVEREKKLQEERNPPPAR